MKKLFSILIPALLWMAAIGAQSPQKLSYQAVLHGSNNQLLTTTGVGLQISILQGSATGNAVYVERHFPTTNANGLVSIEIGGGTVVSGNFAAIDWTSGNYFIKTETDPNGGANYTITGTSPLLSVPYALYASKAGNGFSGSYNDLTGKPILATVATSGTYADLTGKPNLTDTAKYLKTEKEPAFNASVAKRINAADTVKWNAKSNFSGSYTNLTNKPSFTDSINKYSVLLAGNQNIAGNKTFSSDVIINYLTVGRGGGSDESSVALGINAIISNTSGYANTAIGGFALYTSTTGRYNTANGHGALYSNTTGESNTSIGEYSLFTNTTGSGNTAVGRKADVASGNLINATAIGFGAIVDASNKVRIGNNDITVIEGKVAFTNLSDKRVKKNIKDLNCGLDFILKLHPVEYQMKQGDDKINYGFIAQDIETLVGSNNSMLTIGGDKDRTLGLRYTDFIAPMVKAMQEQQKLIVVLNKQNTEIISENLKIKSELLALKAAVDALQKK